jgi:putative ATP-binding cassette transporter
MRPAGIKALLGLLRDGAGAAGPRLAFDLAVAAVADTLVLYSINDTIAEYRAGNHFPARQACVFAISVLLGVVTIHSLMRAASRAYGGAVKAIRLRLLGKVRRIHLAEVERIGGATVVRCLTTDADLLVTASATLIDVLVSVGLCLLTFVYLLWTSPKAAILGFGAFVLLTALTSGKGGRLAQGLAAAESLKVALVEGCLGLLRGLKQVKQHAAKREAMLSEVRARAAEHAAARLAIHDRHAADDGLGLVVFFGLQLAMAFVFPLVFPSEQALVGQLLMTLWYVSSSMTTIFKRQPELAEAAGALSRLTDLEARLDRAIGLVPDAVATAAPGPAFGGFEALSLREAVYRHGDRAGAPAPAGFELGPLDLTIRRGELVLVTGPSGSGKTTFLKLVTGLYEPAAGALSCNGHEVTAPAQQGYLDLFAVTLSDFVLFDRLYGMEDADPERVSHLLRQMDLAGEVSFSDGRFSRVDLSTGQRKRLALIVALLQDRPVHVFDEWAADQDPEFRGVFYREILPELKRRGKTVIAVTHDADHFAMADRRLCFRAGKIEAV